MKALIVGDTGLVGRYLVDHLTASEKWQVCGLSRSRQAGNHEHLAADLLQPDSLIASLRGHTDITHVFYAGRTPATDPQAECDINTQMFINLMTALDETQVAYEHVQLMQGMKWYGSHAGPWKTPACETDARHAGPNFYHTQADWLLARQVGQSWTWSAVRPHQVIGYSDTYPHNLAGVLALYGSICRDQGLPLDFPGTKACFESISMMMDASLLAQVMAFIAVSPQARNRAFNVGNGDYFRWQHMWPLLADFFQVPCGQVADFRLHDRFAGFDAQWRNICQRHELAMSDIQAIGNWQYGDFSFRAGWDDMANLNAIRSAGFDNWHDSEAGLLRILEQYREHKIIP